MSGTSTSKFTAATTVPNQESWGNYQRFNFGDTFPHVKVQAFSQFVPTFVNTSTINIESRNSNYSGFRWHHLSQSSDVNRFGSFYFQSFVSDSDGINIFGFDGTNFNIYVPIDANSNKISNLSPGVSGTDAVNLNQLSSVVAAGTITLTGNVTGSGVLNTPFSTTIVSTLNQIPTPTADVAMGGFKITGLATGTVGTDAVNLTQMNSAITAGTITLTGNVTGGGTVGTPFSTTIVSTLNNIPVATGAININSQNMTSVGNVGIGVASPTIPLQFATATSDCKICLYQTLANSFQVYGFGVTSGILKYTVDAPSASHVFYCGASSTTSTELFRISGTGKVGIGFSSPNIDLQFANSLADCKISLYQIAANQFQIYGFGVISGTLKYSIGNTSSSHVFYAGTSSTTSTELFRIHGTGYGTVLLGDGTFYSRVPSATWFKSGGSAATVASANTWLKAVVTSSLNPPNRQFTTSVNRITFTGSDLSANCVGMFSAAAVLSPSSGTPKLGLAVYLNGTNAIGMQAYISPTAAGGLYTLSIPNTMCDLDPGDYLEIWVLSSTATTITVSELSLSFIAC